MKIVVFQAGRQCDVCLLTEDLELDLAVRFDTLAEASEFAELWGEWMDCKTIEYADVGVVPQFAAA